MNNIVTKIMTIFLVLLSLSSCATRKEIVQFKQDMSFLRVQTESLRQENVELKKMLLQLNQNFAELQNETRRTKADLLTEIDNVKSKSQVIDSKLEDTSYRMSHFLQRVETKVPPAAQKDSLDSTANADSSADSPARQQGIDPLEVYNAAYLDLSKANYQLALQGFQTFIQSFPQSDLADNAQYWLGEVYYAQKDYSKAIEEFKKVAEIYPRGDKVAAALLKIGYSHFNQGDQETGKKFLRIVTERFPNSEAARLARSRLSSN